MVWPLRSAAWLFGSYSPSWSNIFSGASLPDLTPLLPQVLRKAQGERDDGQGRIGMPHRGKD